MSTRLRLIVEPGTVAGFNLRPNDSPEKNPAGVQGVFRMQKAVNVLALVRNGHRYVFLYDDQSLDTLRAQLAIFAEDQELDFNWRDAATLHERILNLDDQQSATDSETEDFPTFF